MVKAEMSGYYGYTSNEGVYYGPGCLKDALQKLVSSLGKTRALIVTGKTLHTKVRNTIYLLLSDMKNSKIENSFRQMSSGKSRIFSRTWVFMVARSQALGNILQ